MTRYPVIDEPPESAGAAHVTTAERDEVVTVGWAGPAGTVAGRSEREGSDGGPEPTALVATICTDTATVGSRPVIVHEVSVVVQPFNPGLSVAE